MTRSPRRVVAFTPGHSEVGGAARRSRLLTTGLATRGWQVRVVARAGTLHRFRLRRSENLVVLEVPGFDRPRLGGLLYVAVAVPLGIVWGWRAHRFLAIQLVSPSTAAAACAAVHRRPWVGLTTTSGALSEVGEVSRRRAWRVRLLRTAATLVGQTELAAGELRALVEPEQIAVLRNPVQVTDPPPLTGAPRVLFTGRFSEEKDLPVLLDAWRTVVSRHPDARLVLAGAGGRYRSVEEDVRALIEADPVLRATVELPGWVDPGPLLGRCDVWVLPSRSEGMSNSLLEACAAGRVIVASAIAPNQAVLGEDHPLFHAVSDTSDLARQLLVALEDPASRARARQHALDAARRHDVPVVLDDLEAILEHADRPRHQHA